MFIIHSGSVKITKKTDDGEKPLVTLGAAIFSGKWL